MADFVKSGTCELNGLVMRDESGCSFKKLFNTNLFYLEQFDSIQRGIIRLSTRIERKTELSDAFRKMIGCFVTVSRNAHCLGSRRSSCRAIKQLFQNTLNSCEKVKNYRCSLST
jgi:hypothetical protein